jgi:hypothetical protein
MSSRLVHDRSGRARKLYSCLTCGVSWPCLGAALAVIQDMRRERNLISPTPLSPPIRTAHGAVVLDSYFS